MLDAGISRNTNHVCYDFINVKVNVKTNIVTFVAAVIRYYLMQYLKLAAYYYCGTLLIQETT
jgi:hypothetical protein